MIEETPILPPQPGQNPPPVPADKPLEPPVELPVPAEEHKQSS